MFKFDGIDLEMFVDVISIDTTLMSERKNDFIDPPSRSGRYYQDFKYDYKEINVTFDIKADTEEDCKSIIDTTSSVFNVSEEKELIIDDNGRVYLALPDGKFSKEKIT